MIISLIARPVGSHLVRSAARGWRLVAAAPDAVISAGRSAARMLPFTPSARCRSLTASGWRAMI